LNTSTAPHVGIVILNWNNEPATQRCLDSLADTDLTHATVYLADNGSQDGSWSNLQARNAGRGIQWISNNANLGFSAGCNPAIRRALDDGCQYVLLLNNDCIVPAGPFLAPAVKLAEGRSDCGIVGGKILFWPDTDQIWSTGGFIRFWGGETHIGHREPDDGRFDRLAERTFISGALMLIKRRVFDEIGLLPEAYFFGKEEWEFSRLARLRGFKLVYQPEFVVHHEASNSSDWGDPMYVYNGTLSKILYKRRNLAPFSYTVWRFAYASYVRFFLRVRQALKPKTFLQHVPVADIHRAMRMALDDSGATTRITRDTLDAFRARFGSGSAA
jgi:GT2 family glycosyltransferase